MRSLSVACALCAVLACVLGAQAQKEVLKPTFFKDVPGPPKAAKGKDGPGLKIFNGGVAARNQFPYQALLYIDLSVICGGSLINEKWVLTAAHCVDSFTTWYVLLGLTESMTPVQQGRSTHITRGGYHHPEYNGNLIINDVGLVQLMRPATLSENVQIIALTPRSKSYIGRMATVSGFGRTDDASASPLSDILHYTSLPVTQNEVCASAYGEATGNDPSVICLRAEGTSSCKGDSGGPLTLQDDSGKLIQIGAVSFGATLGCSRGYPVGYSNLAYLLDWISETSGLSFD